MESKGGVLRREDGIGEGVMKEVQYLRQEEVVCLWEGNASHDLRQRLSFGALDLLELRLQTVGGRCPWR